MTTISLFVQEHGKSAIREIIVEEIITSRGLHTALIAAGISIGTDSLVFLEEIELPLDRQSDESVGHLHHGHRVHVTHCRHIRVTVNFLEYQAQHEFAPSRRVRSVKEWAVKHFHLDHKDAMEHVLRLSGSVDQPSTDTPLNALPREHCELCFDLVPEKRVEG